MFNRMKKCKRVCMFLRCKSSSELFFPRNEEMCYYLMIALEKSTLCALQP